MSEKDHIGAIYSLITKIERAEHDGDVEKADFMLAMAQHCQRRYLEAARSLEERWAVRTGAVLLATARGGIAAALDEAARSGIDASEAHPEPSAIRVIAHGVTARIASEAGDREAELAHLYMAVRLRIGLTTGSVPPRPVPFSVKRLIAETCNDDLAIQLADDALQLANAHASGVEAIAAAAWFEAAASIAKRPKLSAFESIQDKLHATFAYLVRMLPDNQPRLLEPMRYLLAALSGDEIAAAVSARGPDVVFAEQGMNDTLFEHLVRSPSEYVHFLASRCLFRTPPQPNEPLLTFAIAELTRRGETDLAIHLRVFWAQCDLRLAIAATVTADGFPDRHAEPVRSAACRLEEVTAKALTDLGPSHPIGFAALFTRGTARATLGHHGAESDLVQVLAGAGRMGDASKQEGALSEATSGLALVAAGQRRWATAAFWIKLTLVIRGRFLTRISMTDPQDAMRAMPEIALQLRAAGMWLAKLARYGEADALLVLEGRLRRGGADLGAALSDIQWTAAECLARDGFIAEFLPPDDAETAHDPEGVRRAITRVEAALSRADLPLNAWRGRASGTALLRCALSPDGFSASLDAPDGTALWRASPSMSPESLLYMAHVLVSTMRVRADDPGVWRTDPQVLKAQAVLASVLVDPVRNALARHDLKVLLVHAEGALRFLPLAAMGQERPLVSDVAVATWVPSDRCEPNLLRRPLRLAAFGLGRRGRTDEPGSEIDAILRLFPGSPPAVQGADATRTGLSRVLASQGTVLHIGTHGMANSADPLANSLILRGATGRENDAITVAELAGIGLAAYDLIVLAACATGQPGPHDQGGANEELIRVGLARAVLSALWPVSAASTMRIMRSFYGALAGSDTLTPAEALRRAQDTERRHSFHPYHWAAWNLTVG